MGVVCPKCRATYDDLNLVQCPRDGALLVSAKDAARAVPPVPESQRPDPMVGRTLEGRYTILARLGAGSMGTVYRAKQHAMGREVAIKILRSDRAVDDAAKARFLREARTNSLLASPNTVTVFDFGQAQTGELYLAMELLDGESLGQRLHRGGRMSVAASVDTTRQALRSLAEAHAKGIIHRDLKPDNLFFARVLSGGQYEEIVKVLDFGIAKMLRDEDAAMNAVETQAGTVFGTPRYMSPEQAQGKPLDPRSDLYALGVILYQMLTGRPPFADDDAVVVMARYIKTQPRPPSEICPEAMIPADVERVVMRTLSNDPNDRPPTAEALSAELARALESMAAATSGVRISVSQPPQPIPDAIAAGIAPPPPPQARTGLVVLTLIGVGVAAAVLVFLAIHFGTRRDVADVPAPPATTSAAIASATPSPVPSASSEVPTVSLDDLPKAASTATAATAATAATSTATPPAVPGPSASGKKPPTAATGSGRPRPPGSASAGAPSYGIFD